MSNKEQVGGKKEQIIPQIIPLIFYSQGYSPDYSPDYSQIIPQIMSLSSMAVNLCGSELLHNK